LLQAIARVNRPYNELKGNGLILDYYGIFDNLNDALNYKPEELGDVVFPFEKLRENFKNTFDDVWNLFPENDISRDGSHGSFIKAMKIIRDVEDAEKKFDVGFRNIRVLYEALQPDEFLRDYIRGYAWLTKLYILYQKKFYPERAIQVSAEDAARTWEMIKENINLDELDKEYPTYVLDENYLTKLKGKDPETKALDIEGMLTAELRIHEHDDTFKPLSEQMQHLIDQKRAGTLAGIALIEELEKLAEIIRATIEESKRPIGQALAILIKAQNNAVSETVAVEIVAAVLKIADELCFNAWWTQSNIETDLRNKIVLLLTKEYQSSNLLTNDLKFVNKCIELLKNKHYKPSKKS
jgi:type I restriction enzyme R subunit